MTISTLVLKMNRLFGFRLQKHSGRPDEVSFFKGQNWNFRDVHENKFAAESLQKSEANLQTIVNNTDSGYVLIDPDFKVIFFNQHAAKFVQNELHKTLVEGADAVALFPAQRGHFIKNTLQGVLKGTPCIYEVNYPQPDGSDKWYDAKYFPVSNNENKVFGVMLALTDFTERKQVAEQIKNSNNRFELAAKATHDIIWDWNLLTDEIYLSEGYEKHFSYKVSANDRQAQSRMKRIHPDDIKRVTEGIRKEINNPETGFWQDEYRYILKDGSTAYIYDRGYIIYNDEKKPIRMVGAMQDITQRVKAEETLRRSEANLRTIFDSTKTSYILLDPECRIRSFNPVAREWAKNSLKVDLKEGDIWLSYFPENEHEGIKEKARKILNGETIKYETSYLQANESINYYMVSLSPVLNSEKNVLGMCIDLNDITERKQSERETLELVDRLQSKNKDLHRFAYIVSHDLRAPIAKIQGLVSLFDSDPEDPTINSILLESVIGEVTNLDNVVKDMNTIISARDLQNVKNEYITFETELGLIKQVLESEIIESNATITTDFTDPPGIVTAKGSLYSIMYNLLSNAIKYRSSKTPLLIHLQTQQDDKFICLSVKDNGLGIDLERNKEKIFGLYKRFHGDKIPGKGIGLNLVKIQAESLGGRAEVESQVNHGTIFKIFLSKNHNRYATS